eukprot:1157013-Pelagomonas_calceolata.AAC.8
MGRQGGDPHLRERFEWLKDWVLRTLEWAQENCRGEGREGAHTHVLRAQERVRKETDKEGGRAEERVRVSHRWWRHSVEGERHRVVGAFLRCVQSIYGMQGTGHLKPFEPPQAIQN